MADARSTALKLLLRVENTSAYSNIILDQGLAASPISAQDKKLCAALFYGVLERMHTLDQIINSLLDRPGTKLSAEMRTILQLAVYQLLYMNAIPESAAVDEAVKAAKKLSNPSAPGFVNAMLRAFLRGGKALPAWKNEREKLSVTYSCPLWLVEKWFNEYGQAAAEELITTSVGQAPLTVRANTLKLPLDAIMTTLQNEGISCEKHPAAPDALNLYGAGAAEMTAAFREGLYHVQDISSQLCCLALGAKEGETILDLCAAPGGKSFTVAENTNGNGHILAFDLHENRVKLIRHGAKRLGLEGAIRARVGNAKLYNPEIGMVDRVLCDVPCSGLGVIRRKPEIKYKNPAEFAGLPAVQYEILVSGAHYVREGGVLLYSTCTVSRAENDDVVNRFLAENPDFAPEALGIGEDPAQTRATFTPALYSGDGFFVAKFKRVK
ncbi:MAG: 16S rRNA (cytosine(967)-C(5))-methyltransferase RsmB [Oscillospiraceae bacterium]